MSKSKSEQNGEANPEGTGSHGDMPSSSAEAKPNISVMLDTTAQQSPDFQPTPNLQVSEEQQTANIMFAFADKLVKWKLAEWKLVSLKDGSNAYAIVLPLGKWERDPVRNTLRVRSVEDAQS